MNENSIRQLSMLRASMEKHVGNLSTSIADPDRIGEIRRWIVTVEEVIRSLKVKK